MAEEMYGAVGSSSTEKREWRLKGDWEMFVRSVDR